MLASSWPALINARRDRNSRTTTTMPKGIIIASATRVRSDSVATETSSSRRATSSMIGIAISSVIAISDTIGSFDSAGASSSGSNNFAS